MPLVMLLVGCHFKWILTNFRRALCIEVKKNTMQTTLEIQNLKCGGCQAFITGKMTAIEGVQSVSFEGEDSITINHEGIDNKVFKAELGRIGYPVAGEANTIVDKSKSYVSCMIGRIQDK